MTAILDAPPQVTPKPAKASLRAALSATIVGLGAGQQALFAGLTWEDFRYAAAECENSDRKLRITYDRGSLCLMPTSSLHEVWKKAIAMLLEQYAIESRIRMYGLGNLTISHELLDRGFSPDECYYIQNVQAVVDRKGKLDLESDPPPDLSIEIEVTRSALPRLPVMAAFSVPEVWRFDGTTISILLLRTDGTYEKSTVSRAFPRLPIPEIEQLLQGAIELDHVSTAIAFRDWLRANPRVLAGASS